MLRALDKIELGSETAEESRELPNKWKYNFKLLKIILDCPWISRNT